MVIDGVMFLNEIDALELRLRMLGDLADRFVVVESDLTHSGAHKGHRLGEHRERLAPWWDRLLWVKHLATPHPNAWVMERAQRAAIKEAVAMVASDGDIVVFSDVDEIWTADCLPVWEDRVAAAAQDFRLFSVYWRWPHLWAGSIGGPWAAMVNEDWNGLRDIRASMPSVRGGWHFSWMGDSVQHRFKRDSFAHREFATTDVDAFVAEGCWLDGTELEETDAGLPGQVLSGLPDAWYRTRAGMIPFAGG